MRVLEHERRVAGRLRLGLGDPGAEDVRRLGAHLLRRRCVEHAEPLEVALVPPDALVLPLLLDPLGVDVRARVVGGRVRRGSVRDRLDHRRAAAGARTGDRLARRLVDGEHVAAVDADAGDPVADGLVDERLGARLRGQRRRDRPLVVVAEEDERRAGDGGEVRALVERALRRRAVAEVRDRDRRLAAQLLPPREPGRVRHVRRDRDADRRDVVVGRVPPARRMPAPPLEDHARRHPAQEPDRGLAVAREDPVLVLERVDRAGLHRLVVPEDRVRPDPPLPVVDDRALVVRPQQDDRAVELEQVVLREPVDLPVGDRIAVADHATEVALGRKHLRHRRDYL